MRQIKNTLYVFTEDLFLALDGENVVAKRSGKEVSRIPLHTLESIYTFSHSGASPALMGTCARLGIELAFFTPNGRFQADVQGDIYGNVLLRKAQFAAAMDEESSLDFAKGFILGKVYNSRWVLERAIRDHGLRIDSERVKAASAHLAASLFEVRSCDTFERLRGIEGDAAATYYSVFNELIMNGDEFFSFTGRSRKPPRDAVNAMLSMFYSTLSLDCASALRGVGLDPYVGFLHVDRLGRRSLALDCMEELRSVLVDRFVLTTINNKVVNRGCFDMRETGEVLLNDRGRRVLFERWQKRKREVIMHPFLKEKVPWGLVPCVQSQLLAKHLRGDLDGYPPFLWK